MTIDITLSETLNELSKKGYRITKNAIAVEAKVRPSTLSDLAMGSSKAIKLETLNDILNAMHRLVPNEEFTVENIIKFRKEGD